jgi:hypothetical protein
VLRLHRGGDGLGRRLHADQADGWPRRRVVVLEDGVEHVGEALGRAVAEHQALGHGDDPGVGGRVELVVQAEVEDDSSVVPQARKALA